MKISGASQVLLAGIAGVLLFPLNVTGLDLAYFQGDLADTRFCMYLLEHGWRFLTFQTGDFWNAPFLWPEKEVISYSEPMLGNAPHYGIFRLLGFDVHTSFQLWFVSVCLLNYFAAWYFLKRITGHNYAAICGAILFAYALSLHSHTHAQMAPRYFIPLAFLMLWKYQESLSGKHLGLALLCWVGQFYCSVYLGMLSLFPLAAFALFILLARFRSFFMSVLSPHSGSGWPCPW